MIQVTDISGAMKYLNPDLIEKMEGVPDTVLLLVNGKRYMIQEDAEEILERIIAFRRACGTVRGLSACAADCLESAGVGAPPSTRRGRTHL